MKKWRRMQKGRFYSRQMNLVCKTPCFTHGPIIPCVKSQHLLTALAKMAFPYANRPVLHTASKSRKQNPVFYTRQMNPVCKTPCFTHGPDQNSVPVCKNPTFTHGKLAPCVKRPILLTGWYNWNAVLSTKMPVFVDKKSCGGVRVFWHVKLSSGMSRFPSLLPSWVELSLFGNRWLIQILVFLGLIVNNW